MASKNESPISRGSGSKPEEAVRQGVLQELRKLGWKEGQLVWKPEWAIPKTPSDLTKRDRGQRFDIAGYADIAAFANDSREPYALEVLFEVKQPKIEAGKTQLMRYMSAEPMVKMGYWTNGRDKLAIYKSHTSNWIEVLDAPLPKPTDDFTQPPSDPITWATMAVPDQNTLSALLKRLLATTVIGDSRATRTEDQLRELVHTIMVKLQSDAVASLSANHKKPVDFRRVGDEKTRVEKTASAIRMQFRNYFNKQRTRVFLPDDVDDIRLNDETIYAVVAELESYRLLGDDIEILSKAFQIFRTAALRSAGGQYLTPLRIIRPCVMAMEIQSSDKVIDPGQGTGGFLLESARQVRENEFPGETERAHLIKWTNDNLYGIDIDHIGVKLTKAIMVAIGDGSTHVYLGDSVRTEQWKDKYPELFTTFANRSNEEVIPSFTVVVTNPPFGQDLKVKGPDAAASGYTIVAAAASASGRAKPHVDLEIGLIFLEQAYRLLQVGGRVGIVLPETYFFSHKYRWLPGWLEGRLKLRGMINIPMEAFEEFCRAKTNFYIFEKIDNTSTDGTSSIYKPKWFRDDAVMVCTAPTCGLTKGGRMLPLIDPSTGHRVQVKDPDTGAMVDAVNDKLLEDMEALHRAESTDTLRHIPLVDVSMNIAVPTYYDRRYDEHFEKALANEEEFAGFTSMTIGQMIKAGLLEVRGGHGSPSQEQRVGDIPYIKVSDLRAGTVNINPTNRLPRSVAERDFWRGKSSGIREFDLVCPERTSKNIGDFCVVMPGQEQVVMTKEVIVLRPGLNADFDNFYVLWAMTLKIVRDQWKRVIFMQTNREDVGNRYHEILVPLAPTAKRAHEVSQPFRNYYTNLAKAREKFTDYLSGNDKHHFFMTGGLDQEANTLEEDRSSYN